MKTTSINGAEIELVNDDAGNCVYFPNPAKDESKMGMWDQLFGEPKAKIMRANYLSHSKNGYKDAAGNKVRNIRNFEGAIIKEMELRDESEKTERTAKTVAPQVSLADAIGVYKEITKLNNPALKTAVELQMNIIKQLIPVALMDAEIEVLQFLIDLKKAEAKAN
jgi:hypothetical protein